MKVPSENSSEDHVKMICSTAHKPVGARAVTSAAEEPVLPPVPKLKPQSEDEGGDKAGGQGDIQPVGHDYVEEVGKLQQSSPTRSHASFPPSRST